MGSMQFQFEDDTVIVTGGSSGIGRQMALEFADAGATTIIADIREEPKDTDASQPTHQLIRDAGGTAQFVETDVSKPSDIDDLVAAADDFGGVDVMINNAGYANKTSLRETTLKEFKRIQEVNTNGVLFGCQYAAEDMIRRGTDGAIINTASIRSNFAAREQIQYDATKGAVQMITRCAAFELADHDIRVNAVAPGPIATETRPGRAQRVRDEVAADGYTKPIPLGRAGEPAEVATAIQFLASEQASYVTGEILHVDGGYQIY